MASRELNILIKAKNLAGKVFRDVRGDMRSIQSEARRGAANISRNVGLVSVAAAGLVTLQVRAGLESLAELERVNAQTAAVLKSTNSAAGVSAANVRSWAEELENLTTVDDKAIQNTENLLLTFTSIDKKAFRPAIESILDMNAALGGDEESLQGVAIQVGKALQDPVRGLTALRRVGVNFTKQQEAQIRELVKQNRLFEAQQIILAELNKEFGGSAAAQADTYGGKMRRLADAVEDAQMALATAFLPVLEKVSDKLAVFLQDPDTLKNIEGFGQLLAEGLEDAIDIAAGLPWASIGSAFELMGKGAKAALDLFLSAPPWLQTAIITGWGLNKLTGGALGSIVGSLASGLIKGILGINAGVVNINAGVVNGGGVPGVGGVPGAKGGKGGLPLPLALTGLGLAAIVETAVGGWAAENISRPMDPTRFDYNAVAGASGKFAGPQSGQSERFAQDLATKLGVSLAVVKQGIVDAINNQGRTFDQAVVMLGNQAQATRGLSAGFLANSIKAEQANARVLSVLSPLPYSIAQLAGKDFSPTVIVNTSVNVSARATAAALTAIRLTQRGVF